MQRPILRVALLASLAALVAAAPAPAAITASTITSSAVLKYDVVDTVIPLTQASPVNQRTVSGTATGATGDTVEVRCYGEAGSHRFQLGSTTLAADGTWTVSGPVNNTVEPCRLRAVPQQNPGALAPFAPTELVFPGTRYTRVDGNGKIRTWGVEEVREKGYQDTYSLADCALCDVKWRSPSGEMSQWLFYYNQSTAGGTYDFDPDGAGAQPSEARPQATVGGRRAFGSSALSDTARLDPAYVEPTLTHTRDAVTGDSQFSSTEYVYTCTGDNCNTGAVQNTGVRSERTYAYVGDGQVVRIVDVWRNTSPASVDLDLGFSQSQQGGPTGVQLPGEADFTARTNTVVRPAAASAATFTLKNTNTAPVNPLTNPVGTISFAPQPDEVVFTDDSSEFYTHHRFSLAPGEARTLRSTFVMAGTLEATRALGATEQDRLAAPSVEIASPAQGAAVGSPVTVTGRATDDTAVTSLKVNGVEVPVSGQAFTTLLALAPGAQTIIVEATDGAGQTTTATRSVTVTAPAGPVVTPPPTPRPAPRDTVRPVVRIARASTRRQPITLRGTSSSDTRRVLVAVSRRSGKRCRFLGARGRFGKPRSCSRPVEVSAKGTRSWSLRLPRLARGSYGVTVRAVDAAGNVGRAQRTLRVPRR